MKLNRFNQPRFYLRRDPDAGWTLAVWKWRVFFQMVGRAVRRRSDAEIDELRRVYNDTYCRWRREGVGGGDSERHAMRVLLAHLDGVAASEYLAKVEADPRRAAALQRARDRAPGVAERHPRCGYPYCACVGECFAASQPGVTAGVKTGDGGKA